MIHDKLDIIDQLEKTQNKIIEFLSPITEKDKDPYLSFIEKPKSELSNKFEDSFEYIRMYFNSGRYQGFKYYDNEDLIIFALEKKKKTHFKIFKPIGEGAFQKLPYVVAALNSISPEYIQTVCLDNEDLKALKKNKRLEIKNIKEFNYWIYDLETLNDLRGIKWKNVRQKISAFSKNHQKLKIERLNKSN